MGSYWFTDMGMLNEGNMVEIKMNISANVRVMTEEAFKNYKRKKEHAFIGGYVKFSPYHVTLPEAGHWYVVVDRGGLPGTVSAQVLIYKGEKKKKDKTVKLPEQEKL